MWSSCISSNLSLQFTVSFLRDLFFPCSQPPPLGAYHSFWGRGSHLANPCWQSDLHRLNLYISDLFKDLLKQSIRKKESKEREKEKRNQERAKQNGPGSRRRSLEKVKDGEQDPGVVKPALGSVRFADISQCWMNVQRHRKEASTRVWFYFCPEPGVGRMGTPRPFQSKCPIPWSNIEALLHLQWEPPNHVAKGSKTLPSFPLVLVDSWIYCSFSISVTSCSAHLHLGQFHLCGFGRQQGLPSFEKYTLRD